MNFFKLCLLCMVFVLFFFAQTRNIAGSRTPSGRFPASELVSEDVLTLPAEMKAGEVFSVIKEPSILLELEKRGFSFPKHFDPNLSNADSLTNDKLYANFLYQNFSTIVSGELDKIVADEKASQPAARGFDKAWLKSRISRYELIGVVNRLDRVSFNPAHCGEMRFIYRLSYSNKAKGIYSRMPMTVMVKYIVTHEPEMSWEEELSNYGKLKDAGREAEVNQVKEWNKCKRFARAWVWPKGIKDPTALLDWMDSPEGPLSDSLVTPGKFHSIETNLQAVRVPSSARPKLAGHAVYLLKVLRKQDGILVSSYMENTLDSVRINKLPALKQELKIFLADQRNFKRLDRGILEIPQKYLATSAVSYSPFGVSRKENQQLNKIFSEAEIISIFAPSLKKQKTYFVKTPSAAARRINDLSCVGCHQGRATAGFHFLGIDRASTHPLNALIFEGSGHFELELKRRKSYLERTLQNYIPDPKRDFSIAPPRDASNENLAVAQYGHFCGLPDGGFTDWKCAPGLECKRTDEAVGEKDLGKCFPVKPLAGDPCMYGEVSQESHKKDQLLNVKTQICGNDPSYICSPLDLGHPAGTCTMLSSELNLACKPNSPLEICGYFAGTGFNGCIEKMFRGVKTFVQCADEFKGLGLRGKCNENKACRNDYVCVRTGKYDPVKRDGACAPSYFLFQVRADGHPGP